MTSNPDVNLLISAIGVGLVAGVVLGLLWTAMRVMQGKPARQRAPVQSAGLYYFGTAFFVFLAVPSVKNGLPLFAIPHLCFAAFTLFAAIGVQRGWRWFR